MQDVKHRLLLGRELRGSWIVFLSYPPSSSPVRWVSYHSNKRGPKAFRYCVGRQSMYAALVYAPYIVEKHEFIQRNAALQLCCPPRPCGSSDVLGSHVRCREAALLVSVGAREHGTVGGHAREGSLDSWRSAAPFCMSADGPSPCQCCARSERSSRTARCRCGACTRSARTSCCAPSCS